MRRRAGEDRQVQLEFEDLLEEIRSANPLFLGEGKGVAIWSRKQAMMACEAVHLVDEWLELGNVEQLYAAKERAVAWLEANKPKDRSRVAQEALGGGDGTNGEEQDVANSSGVVRADVEGEMSDDPRDGGEGGARGRASGDGASGGNPSDGRGEGESR